MMKTQFNRFLTTLFVSLTLASTHASAGRSCEERPPSPQVVQNALTLANDARQKLMDSGAEVAIIARAGQNLSKYGVRYSHLGFVWRDHPKGPWTVVHELNQCGTANSEIFDEGLGNFFLDDLWRMEAAILIPSESTQHNLSQLLATKGHIRFHDGRYNMVAYPFSTRYQNSNQWALEVIAAAEAKDAQIASREQAQLWLKLAGYQPTELKLDTLTRLGARLTRANIAFDDHPDDLRWSNRIRTVTVDSIFQFIVARDNAAKKIVVGGGPA